MNAQTNLKNRNTASAIMLVLFSIFGLSFSNNLVAKPNPEAPKEIKLNEDEMKKASDIYFQTCAGCHGTSRKGATGPALLPEARTKLLGTAGLKAFITNGTPNGMPDWGKQGVLKEDEIDLLARFLQVAPPPIPEFSLDEMKAYWKVIVNPEDRPTKPQHNRNWKNYMGVILRDAGQVAIIDGDTKEMINIVETGYAVHILRTSATGRYFYSIGRDGKVTLIDNFMKKPDIVAEGKASFDARSIEVSKYKGDKGDYMDKYIIVGGYTPAHFVIMDAMTLEPLQIVATSGYYCDTQEYTKEARVAAIVASHHDPLWVVNVKETGQVWLVDYSNIDALNISMINTARYLHDGGWDETGKYFIVAANASNKLVVIDVPNKKLEKIIDVGVKPHPGRGTNITNPKYGKLWITGHLGENRISFIKTDAGKGQWSEVATVELPGVGGGNLFVKSHPKSSHVWCDRPLSNSVELQRSLFVIDTKTLKVIKTLKVPAEFEGRAVHMEYNMAGDEVWVSVWGQKDSGKSALLIYDDKTLKLKKTITGAWVNTPTGHFNVYNTVHDIY